MSHDKNIDDAIVIAHWQREYAASLWTVMSRYGGVNITEPQLEAGHGIHCLQNIMTMSKEKHSLFDTLQIWLEPVSFLQSRAFNF